MKQKDKKKHYPKAERLTAVKVPDLEELDDVREQAAFKAQRSAHKQHEVFKENLELVRARIAGINSNYNYVVEREGNYYQATLSGRL